jgi:hypothetical protein
MHLEKTFFPLGTPALQVPPNWTALQWPLHL